MPKYVQLNGLKLRGTLEEFSITLQFSGSKIQKIMKKIRVLSAFFLRIEVLMISNPSTQLKKHQTFKFLLINNFYELFLMLIFNIFQFFRKYQLHILKSFYAFYFM